MIQYWEEALGQTIGLKVQVAPGERKLLMQQLYRARTESGDERFAELVIITPQHPENELWITHKDADER